MRRVGILRQESRHRASRYNLVFEDKTVAVYEDRQFLPRAFWVYDYEVANNQEELIRLLGETDFSQKVILEKKPQTSFKKEKINKIEWLEYSPNKAVLVAESDAPGLVFLSDNFYPGWTARIDGQPTEILRANYTFRAVSVSRGRHLISFEYKPRSLLYGSLISFMALANLVVLFSIHVVKITWEKRQKKS